MKKIFLLIGIYLLSFNANAAHLPLEISNDFLKSSTVDLIMQMYPQTMYHIDIYAAERDTQPEYEVAAGYIFMRMQDASCTVAVAYADSTTCSQLQKCEISAASINLPNCDVRTTQSIKAQVSRLKSGKKPYVLRQQCDVTRKNCQMRWVKR